MILRLLKYARIKCFFFYWHHYGSESLINIFPKKRKEHHTSYNIIENWIFYRRHFNEKNTYHRQYFQCLKVFDKWWLTYTRDNNFNISRGKTPKKGSKSQYKMCNEHYKDQYISQTDLKWVNILHLFIEFNNFLVQILI